jgi:HD-GYP domain-containing protein (c-di-GMP phosphodiesterase class II)
VSDARTAEQHALDVAFFLAAAFINRRLYTHDNPIAAQNFGRLCSELDAYLARPSTTEFSFGLLQAGVSVAGQPLLQPPDGVAKLAAHMRQRGFEIVTLSAGVSRAELETLIALLTLEAAELTALDVGQWLAARGAHHVALRHIEIQDAGAVRNMRQLYEHGRDALGESFRSVASSGLIELGAMAELAGTMLDLVMNSEVPIATMVALRGRDDFMHVHAMNVAMLAAAQATTLGLDDDVVRAVTVAALVHDVGKASMPRELLSKPPPLSADELGIVYRHPADGARLLLRTHGTAGLEAIVAAEHHLSWSDDPHLASQLVAIADTFDAIRSLRPFADRESLRGALRFMLDNMKHRLNPYLLQRFALMCGMYQPGDEVTLTTGERARVVSTNVEIGTKPVVEVHDRAAGAVAEGTLLDLSEPRAEKVTILSEPCPTLTGLTVDAIDAVA